MPRSTRLPIPLLIPFLAAAPLAAQGLYSGLSLNVAVPQGSFSSGGYPANPGSGYVTILPGNGFFPTAQVGTPPTTQGYDTAVGLQYTATFPLDRTWAVRAQASFFVFKGTGTSPGYPSEDLRDFMASLGADVMAFLGRGSATRAVGPYVLGGLSMDFEGFSSSYNDPWDSASQTRLGGTVGVGYAFPGRYPRFTVEAAYHATLTGTGGSNPPAANFLRIGVGFMF